MRAVWPAWHCIWCVEAVQPGIWQAVSTAQNFACMRVRACVPRVSCGRHLCLCLLLVVLYTVPYSPMWWSHVFSCSLSCRCRRLRMLLMRLRLLCRCSRRMAAWKSM